MESLLEFAESHPDKVVVKIRIEIGELTCVEREQLRFCYDSIKIGTELENSSMEMETVSAVVKCPFCNYEGPPKYWDEGRAMAIPTLQCPKCGKATEAVAGHDCAIKSVQLADFAGEKAIAGG